MKQTRYTVAKFWVPTSSSPLIPPGELRRKKKNKNKTSYKELQNGVGKKKDEKREKKCVTDSLS